MNPELVLRIIEENKALKAQGKQLSDALKIYADKSKWNNCELCCTDDVRDSFHNPDHNDGWRIAQQALADLEKSNE